MLLSESKIREIIREALEGLRDKDIELILNLKKDKLIYVNSGDLYISKDRETSKRFSKLISDLQSFLQKNWKYSDVIIGNGGQLRPMLASLKGGGDRQKGTKHGIGLAKDVKFFIGIPDEFTGMPDDLNTKIAPDSKRLGIQRGMDAARLSKERQQEIISMMHDAAKNHPEPDKSADDILNDLLRSPANKYSEIIDLNSSKEKVKEDEVEIFVDIFAKYKEDLAKYKEELAGRAPMLKYGLGRNKELAKNKELVKLMYKFSKLPENSDLIWGGTFSGSRPDEGLVQGKGIDEFHHFEYTTKEGIRILSKPSNQVNKIIQRLKSAGVDLGISVNEMCSNLDNSKAARGKLYAKLLELKPGISSGAVAQADVKK